ncbi:hypothetical protein EN745_13570 [Mesorhizobium sp. M4A.F.Ca.ET.022.05.2.1]|uniref:hypothetical protein n=1 Tax=Mesorhizobium sp. M4A.F.Ca.ET.022.05.2.1 TaxID=2496653 RepID=UPI000FC9FF36|nr:hypothetical protein [Mesorhizobium sp. M4A.F.Ca.ET.022.05.2.1]RVC80200.1 hypothetical protein EN745_13570 [Mesorhizobium sp. M4A.F.Ca.ET.022.05.2.1]
MLPIAVKLRADDKAMDRYRRTAGIHGIEHVDWESDWKDGGYIELRFRNEEQQTLFLVTHYLDVVRK